jgi:hypothetical protein
MKKKTTNKKTKLEKSEFQEFNSYKLAKNSPKNLEHFEAVQTTVDRLRKEHIAKLPKETQDKYKALEEVILRLLDKHKMKYALTVWPEGEIGAIQYQAFHYGPPYTPEASKDLITYIPQYLNSILRMITLQMNYKILVMQHSKEGKDIPLDVYHLGEPHPIKLDLPQ